MSEQKIPFVYIVDADRKLKGYVRYKDIKDKTGWVDDIIEPIAASIQMGTTLRDALSEMLVVDYANMCVVDEHGRVRGLINTQMVQQVVVESEQDVGRRYSE
jgi:Mg/Co/Ni transporter MgtE